MPYETIKYEVAEQILTITLNRPDKLNAFNGVMQQELIDAFDAADNDDNIRAVIVTGKAASLAVGSPCPGHSAVTSAHHSAWDCGPTQAMIRLRGAKASRTMSRSWR